MTFREFMLEETGYETKTTFWEDFTIADHFGPKAIVDTYKRAFNEWKSNYIYMTELVLVLNHKIWQHYNNGNCTNRYDEIYNKLWEMCDQWCCDNLKDKELQYFYRVLD